ncbi:hypothetical protein HPP92_009614 [Vanilla planifolia]|uniref:Pentatricopeptide repeat-containing protein n=1 Tax=Vanilla planifolia TaxID=51239 RepID=A0A835RCQ1_VANPL|nr:hypothetical protein HPP92_009614 [Vanilla planifolia]
MFDEMPVRMLCLFFTYISILFDIGVLLNMLCYHKLIASKPWFESLPRKIPAFCNLYHGSCNMVCSPELPDWFRFAESEQSFQIDNEEDFVLPPRLESLERSLSRQSQQEHLPYVQFITSETAESDADQISNILKVRFSSPEEVSFALRICSARVSKNLVDRVLLRFSNDWIPALGFFRWAGAQVSYKHSAESYDMMIDILGKAKHFDAMWGLVGEMNRLGGLTSLSTISKIIRRLAGAAKWKDAIKAFHDMEYFGVAKSTVAMNILLDSLCKERSVMRARDAFLDLRRDIPPDASSFNILVHGWCKARKFEEAWQTLEEMKESGFKPCVITYTSLIEAYCLEKNFQKADAILFEMHAEGCPPNIITYTIMMHSFGKAKETQKAFLILERMKRDGCFPDASFYSSLIYILGRAGRLKDACNVYEEMSITGISPHVTTFNTLISAACSHSQEEYAFKLLLRMDESSCKPDIKTYTPLLKLSCRRKWTRVLLYLLGHMFKRDISLDFGTYILLVHKLCRNGKLKHACIFYEEMIFKGFVPRVYTSDMLMEALGRKNMDAVKSRIQKLMLVARKMQQLN